MTRERAREIAEVEVSVRRLGVGITEVLFLSEIFTRKPSPYTFDADLDRSWIAYVDRGPATMLQESLIIVMDVETGGIVYSGGASDEG